MKAREPRQAFQKRKDTHTLLGASCPPGLVGPARRRDQYQVWHLPNRTGRDLLGEANKIPEVDVKRLLPVESIR